MINKKVFINVSLFCLAYSLIFISILSVIDRVSLSKNILKIVLYFLPLIMIIVGGFIYYKIIKDLKTKKIKLFIPYSFVVYILSIFIWAFISSILERIFYPRGYESYDSGLLFFFCFIIYTASFFFTVMIPSIVGVYNVD